MAHRYTALILLIAAFLAGCGAEDDTQLTNIEPTPDEHVLVEPEPQFDGPIVPETDLTDGPEPVVESVPTPDPEAEPETVESGTTTVTATRQDTPSVSTADRPEWPLIQAIRRAPWDREAILKLAEWYDEHDPPRAELVRVQLEISPLKYDDPRLKELRQKERQLIEENLERWTEPLRSLGPAPDVDFDVGLIEELSIDDATDEKLACLANVPELRELHVDIDQVSVDGVRLIASLPELDGLMFEGNAVSKECIDALMALPARTSIHIYCDDVDDDVVEAMNKARIASFDSLSPEEKISTGVRFASSFDSGLTYGEMMTGFNLSQSGIDDDQLQLVSALTHLEGLGLFETNITNEGMSVIAGMKRLKHLDLSDTYVRSIEALAPLTALESLQIYPAYGYSMDDDGLAAIENFTQLRHLMLYDDEASDATVRRLAGMKKLKNLDLNVGYLDDDSCLESLAGMTDMHRLSVYCDNVSDAALKNVAGMNDLEFFAIEIDRGDGSGLQHLAGLSKLKRLGLSGDGVSDAGLNHLASLKNLRAFMAQGSKITPEGAARLAAQLPQVTIVTDERVVKSPRESYTLKRYRVGSLSIHLPIDWMPPDARTVSAGGVYAKEDGWDLVGGWSSANVVGPAEISLFVEDAEDDATVDDVLKAALEYESDATVLKRDVVQIPGVDIASCVLHLEDDLTRLLAVIKTPDGIAEFQCEVVPPRYEEFEHLFLAVARSIVVSEDVADHAEDDVELRIEPGR